MFVLDYSSTCDLNKLLFLICKRVMLSAVQRHAGDPCVVLEEHVIDMCQSLLNQPFLYCAP